MRAFSESSGEKTTVERMLVNLGIRIEITKEKVEMENVSEEKVDNFKILQSYVEKSRRIEVADFAKYFRNRFETIRNMLKDRAELQNLVSINKISGDRQGISLIGIVFNKRVTKNDNIILELEDNTGRVSALITKSKPEAYAKAKDILLDDIIGLKCSGSKEIVFVNDILYPDVFVQEKKRNKEEEMAVFISDTHIGSINFLEKSFEKFISWINGGLGGDDWQKVKYLFIVGDSVDGVGVHPAQESFLTIKDLKEQYNKLASYLGRIRKEVKIILCPGQHDASRLAEPQTPIEKEYAYSLYEMDNMYLVSNPALIQIGDAGFKVLMYHGDSMHDFVNEIDHLRLNRGQDTPAKITKEMLKRRHLAPVHSYAVYVPTDEDHLVIRDIPDIVTTGEMHRGDIENYNNVLIIANSCWQSTTPFEEKMGNHPIPCKVPIFNLKTRELKIMDFELPAEKKEEVKSEIKQEIKVDLKKEEIKQEVKIEKTEVQMGANIGEKKAEVKIGEMKTEIQQEMKIENKEIGVGVKG